MGKATGEPVGGESGLNCCFAVDLLRAIAVGQVTSRALVSDCLERISARDGDVKAWLSINHDAIAQAEMLDALPATQRGRLHGLPVAIKDVFDTAELPTTHNSPLFADFQPAQDAACVDLLRAQGAIILGKTDTTEFAAAGRNAATGNPHDLTRTSGGSSAGSAAAVGDFHVPLALATQTGGSTIRPASFCGIYGFKPSFGLVSREGVKIYANSLDTVGWYGRCVEDLWLLADAFEVTETVSPDPVPDRLRVAVARGPYADQLQYESIEAMETAAGRLADGGHEVKHISLPGDFEKLDKCHRTIMFREGAAAFLNLARRHGENLHDDFHERVENREGHSLEDLRKAYDFAAYARVAFEECVADFDLVMVPSAPGYAPEGREPGNPVFNAMWTLLGVPCIHVPVSGEEGALPIGVTFVGPRFSDQRILACVQSVARLIDLNLKPRCA